MSAIPKPGTGFSPPVRLLTPAEVSVMLRVDPKTVTRWARAGKLSSVRTPGGHRRYDEREVLKYLAIWEGPRAAETGGQS